LDITKASLENDKAQDVVVINLAGKTSFADYMVIATGTSQRQVAAMAVHLKEKMKLTGQTEISLEGTDQNDWVLIDSGDVVVHLFRPEIREFYALEKIWSGEMPQSDEVA
jgi:ribosome-associated protein